MFYNIIFWNKNCGERLHHRTTVQVQHQLCQKPNKDISQISTCPSSIVCFNTTLFHRPMIRGFISERPRIFEAHALLSTFDSTRSSHACQNLRLAILTSYEVKDLWPNQTCQYKSEYEGFLYSRNRDLTKLLIVIIPAVVLSSIRSLAIYTQRKLRRHIFLKKKTKKLLVFLCLLSLYWKKP